MYGGGLRRARNGGKRSVVGILWRRRMLFPCLFSSRFKFNETNSATMCWSPAVRYIRGGSLLSSVDWVVAATIISPPFLIQHHSSL